MTQADRNPSFASTISSSAPAPASSRGRTAGAVERIPGSPSHGCARSRDADAKSTLSDESNKFFNLVQDGDCVRLHHRSVWRAPTFGPCKSDGDCSLDD
ncbi:MAG TPA: hypothetical protein VIF40_16880 [Methylosinus sp.]|jgi:hypothetical protein|uniref:hypothetical protein n=1 Tax=Methylosinus sp. TaxID=427 RepID=UPI002F945213